jgi:hypothetical protein
MDHHGRPSLGRFVLGAGIMAMMHYGSVVGQPGSLTYDAQAPAAGAIDFDEITATDVDAETGEDGPISPRPWFPILGGFANTSASSSGVAMLDDDASGFGMDDDGELLPSEADVQTAHSGPAEGGLLGEDDDDDEDDGDEAASGRSANDTSVQMAQLLEPRFRAFVARLRRGPLGPNVGAEVVVEWQKRGLPHVSNTVLHVHGRT